MQSHSKKRVCYYYDGDIGNFYYGYGHLMKPHRLRMTHNLILNYGIYRFMKIYTPRKVSSVEMTKFHSDSYIKLLRAIRPDNMAQYERKMLRFNVGGDCPVFEGLYEFCQMSAGGSIDAAWQLNKQKSDICINWSGGLHHAKKSRASGFCYVNDVVLGILELLIYHPRVLYVDIDVHHGDGVEEAFYTTDRVMTVSFHKFGKEYFPGTGDISDTGGGFKGKYYAINVPLHDGISDESYESIFVPVVTRVVASYQPNAIVLQCGADSLTDDRLGCFNLTVHGHGKCVEFIRKFNLPLLLLGGGGYTLKNVARLWTYETSLALGVEIVNAIPYNDYLEYYGPDYQLHSAPNNMTDENSPQYLNTIKECVFENLRMLPHAPGVQVQTIPSCEIDSDGENDEDVNKDGRLLPKDLAQRIALDNELSDSEDEGRGGRRDQHSFIKDHFGDELSNLELAYFDPDEAEVDKENSGGPGRFEDKIKFGIARILKEHDGGNLRKVVFTVAKPEKPEDVAAECDHCSKHEIKSEKDNEEELCSCREDVK